MTTLLAYISPSLVVLNWLIRIWALFFIPKGRKPVAAMAWILAISLIPLVGIVLFFLIGSPKLSRTRRSMQRTIDGLIESATSSADETPPGLDHDSYARYMPLIQLTQALGKMPARRGNKITVLPGYENILHDIEKQIGKAKEYVYLEFYAVALDNTTRPIFDAMEAAVQRGVLVYMLFDTFGSRRYKGYKAMTKELTRIGVVWRPLLPLSLWPSQYNRPDLRNHRKLVVIDGKRAYIGSINLIDASYQRKDALRYEELAIRLNGPTVSQCAAIFAADWYSETGVALEHFAKPVEIEATRGTLAQLLPSGPSYDHENNLQLFVALLYSAKRRIVITNPYLVPDEAFLAALIAAVRRGVSVTIINSHIIDQWLVGHAQRSYYHELLKEGIVIYLRHEPILLHAKHVTIDDDIAVIGSSNMDIRSFQLDQEAVMVVYDEKVVKQLHKIQSQYLNEATKLEYHTWKNRNKLEELFDNIARLTAALQ